MLADVDDIVKRAGVLLDDPSNSVFTEAYLMPFIDQCYDELDVDLERAGMQYVEAIAVVLNPAGTSDLTPLMQDGAALSSMKFPKRVQWKLPGEPDSLYRPSTGPVVELQDFPAAAGAWEWRFADGALQVTSASIDVTLRIYFDQVSTNMVDPSTGVVRGTAHILAAAVASEVYAARKGMEKQADRLSKKRDKLWNAFKSVLVMNQQSRPTVVPPMHPRLRVATPYVPAPTS